MSYRYIQRSVDNGRDRDAGIDVSPGNMSECDNDHHHREPEAYATCNIVWTVAESGYDTHAAQKEKRRRATEFRQEDWDHIFRAVAGACAKWEYEELY